MANTTGLGDTIYAAVRKAINDAGDGSGGGGGGDLTTATVTLNRAEGFLSSLGIQCAYITNDAGMLDSTNSTVYSEESSVEFTAVLYKGKAIAYPTSEGVALSITGDATYDSDLEVYIITGDCTFTFADA